MQELITRMINERVWAVVGVSADESKFGTRIYRDLKQAGYRVYGVNPKLDALDGDRIYPDLASLPEKPAVVDVVVPPALALGIVETCMAQGIPNVWFQPGAEEPNAIAWAKAKGMNVVHGGPCAMVDKRHW